MLWISEKKFEEWIIIQLVGNLQKTLKLKYCSSSSVLQVLSDEVVQKKNKTQEKKSSVEDKIWKTIGRYPEDYEINEMHLWKPWRDH